ncbi:MFS transporter [Streptomyces sp. SID10853]|uniref:MFS transporter n=1 Tax=Streptomyces sp. SID10853 TaxID=2706028 RepID=UPI0013BF8567|nr:MFS transporter [Streptomyces sp. SID10853]NDZ79880.1 MFS transporter [Streptomyces sp. SID10853]
MMLINRNYRLLWAGQLVSQIGDFAFATTLSLWVGQVLLVGKPYAPAAASALVGIVAVGTLAVGPIAGVFVDRWDRRRTMLVADLVRAGLIGVLTVVAFLPNGTLPDAGVLLAVYATVLLSTSAAQFFNPARFALIGNVVKPEERARASGIGQATQAIAIIAGPPLAAPVLFVVGVRWALLLNALSFLASFVAVRAVRVAAAVSSPIAIPGLAGVRAEFMAGLRLVTGSRAVTALMVTVALVTVGADALNTLNVFFVTDNLHADASWYGTLEMALGCGLIAGALLATRVVGRLGAARTFSLGLLLTGLGLVFYSRLGALGPSLVVLAVVGMPLAAVNTALTPVLLASVPQSHLGRVISVINPVQQLGALVGVSGAGWLASTALRDFHADVAGIQFGRIDTIFTAAGLLVVVGGFYAAIALRSAEQKKGPVSQKD